MRATILSSSVWRSASRAFRTDYGQLVEEDDAVVGETPLPGRRMLPPMRPASEMES
jgi:hypothetical protein